MKARIKATGEIVAIEKNIGYPGGFVASNGRWYDSSDLELMVDKDPDYWTRLEHTYAGMAMQGILACEEWKIAPREGVSFAGEVALQAQEIAHALVKKLKEKEERK